MARVQFRHKIHMVGPDVSRAKPGERAIPMTLNTGIYDASVWDVGEFTGNTEGRWDLTQWDTSEFGADAIIAGPWDAAAWGEALWG